MIRTGLEYPTATPFGAKTTRTSTADPTKWLIVGGASQRQIITMVPAEHARISTTREVQPITTGGDGGGTYPTSGQLWPLPY